LDALWTTAVTSPSLRSLMRTRTGATSSRRVITVTKPASPKVSSGYTPRIPTA
jgi:hypothetical protein